MRPLLFFLFLLPFQFLQAQNLIVNPGAELDPATNGWTVALGPVVNPWRQGTEVIPHGGTYHFYAGDDSPDGSELYQDIDVSSYAASIDAGSSTFNFTAWMRVYNFTSGSWNDQARAYVEYRDASSTVLSTYDTGLRSTTAWIAYSDSRVAPVGTRTIRIRLTATKLRGSEADGYFDDLVLTHSVTLPVTLLSFSSTLINDAIEIQWQTSTEEYNDYFTLEKSEDGITWKTISIQKGSLYAKQLSSYTYTDNQPSAGIQYYRLTQTDIDGARSTFPIITQEFSVGSLHNLFVYPNPSNGPVTINTSAVGEKRIRIFSTGGQTLLHEIAFESNEYKIDLSALSAGHYIIELLTSASVERTVFVKY